MTSKHHNLIVMLLAAVALMPLSASAQTRFGYLSLDRALHATTAYAEAQAHIDSLTAQYQGELRRVEDEFNTKYEDFVEVQNELATPIRLKRQAELQELMEKNIAFKEEARRLLRQATDEALAPLNERLHQAIGAVAAERGLAFVLNTDGDTLPFVDKNLGEDITDLVIRLFEYL